MSRLPRAVIALCWLPVFSCSFDNGVPAPGAQGAAASQSLVMQTDEFTVAPGQERYLCFTKRLEEDVVIDGYSSKAQRFVHHLVFVQTLVPEPEGFSECETLFRMTWDPLYISGAGDSALEFPDDAGHKLTKGTQLLVQMHLLNAGDRAVQGSVAIDMHRSTAANPRPVSTYVFGTTKLALPPHQQSQVAGHCEVKEPLQLIAAFPHMHMLGTGLRFERGADDRDMKTLFAREPYDFDDQHIEAIDIALQPGDRVRTTCAYDNTSASPVMFGESTTTEMCFFIAFAIDRDKLSLCTEPSRVSP